LSHNLKIPICLQVIKVQNLKFNNDKFYYRGPPYERTIYYTKSREKEVEGDADFFDGTYFMDEDHDTYDCLFQIKSPPEKYELLKNISHHNILGLISYDVKKKIHIDGENKWGNTSIICTKEEKKFG
jgi:hypothetical protein